MVNDLCAAPVVGEEVRQEPGRQSQEHTARSLRRHARPRKELCAYLKPNEKSLTNEKMWR